MGIAAQVAAKYQPIVTKYSPQELQVLNNLDANPSPYAKNLAEATRAGRDAYVDQTNKQRAQDANNAYRGYQSIANPRRGLMRL